MSSDTDNRPTLEVRPNRAGKAATGREVRVVVRVPPPWFDVQFVDDAGIGIPNVEFKAAFSDKTTAVFVTDDEGYFMAEKVPEGEIRIQLADGSPIEPWGDRQDMKPAHDDQEQARDELVEYVIRSGDSLSAIAKRFGIRWPHLYQASGPDGVKNSERLRSGDPNLIFPGEAIWVPTRRRAVRIHTDYAATCVTRIRVRGQARPRTEGQKRSARIQHVYARGLEHLCVDNLVVAAGWDKDKDEPNIKALCKEIEAELGLFGKKFTSQWCLFLIQGATMQHHDRNGAWQSTFDLSMAPIGRVGAYSVFEADGRLPTRAIFDPDQGLGQRVGGGSIAWSDLITDQEETQRYLDTHVEITVGAIHFRTLPVWYQAPTTSVEWANIVWRGGRGVLDDRTGQSGLDAIRHERNLNVLRQYNAVFRGQLASYIDEVKRITPEQGEAAIRRLGKPPEPYWFPLPSGFADRQLRELLRERARISSFRAWVEVSKKIFEIQDHRWSSTATRHQEGSLFFRVKFTLEPSAQELINEVTDTYLFGHLSSYSTVKVEWNFDIGSDGFKIGRTKSRTFKDGGKLVARKFKIGAGQEVEIDDSGDEKIAVKGTFMGYGMSVDSDGGMKVTGSGPGGVTVSSTWNERSAEGSLMGADLPVPGLGSIYLGFHFVLVRQETLLMFVSRAPGFFERKGCDELVRTYWKNLTFPEKAKLERLGWEPDAWDVKHLLPPAELPATTRMEIGDLHHEQRIAAAHLGFTGLYRENWRRFWRSLPPVEEIAD